MNRRIFVTGSEGFIGSHLTEKLLKLGYFVKAYVCYNSFNSIGWLENIDKRYHKNLEIIFGDIITINSPKWLTFERDTLI